jgi:hypothetical protein
MSWGSHALHFTAGWKNMDFNFLSSVNQPRVISKNYMDHEPWTIDQL